MDTFDKEDMAERIHRYLSMWRDDERYTDLNLMLDKGLTDLAAYTLSGAGAIDSQICYDNAKPIEREIERLVDSYTGKQRKKDLKEFWVDTLCWVNPTDNEHYFINSEIHYVDDKELRDWGFKPSEEVDDGQAI